MCEVYCQSMQAEGEFSNFSKGGKHFAYTERTEVPVSTLVSWS